jgi:hypothetical protein
MSHQDCRVFNLTASAVNCCHTEADALTPLETIGENAVGRK